MDLPSAPLHFPENPIPDSAGRRRFRALARSAPWLSTSLNLEIQVPSVFDRQPLNENETVKVKIRQREAIVVHNSVGEMIFQKETFSLPRSREYLASKNTTWQLSSQLSTPVFTEDQLVLRRPKISGYGELLPLDYWQGVLDPVEIAGEEPASLDLAFDHPTYIHELAELTHHGRRALAAVLSPGHTYKPAVAGYPLVPAGSRTLVVLDQSTGICLLRKVLQSDNPSDPAPDLIAHVIAQDEYYINSQFQSVHWLDQPVIHP
ncbi:hypothetical protein [Glutamicibacter sp. JC586]|uniref:hypothetical protein n=1 Tax=Glutamicibacter sp. JC586 TaxID=2590552 RepID=UPI00135CA703|nr:hypothetical protein [Glutamicibacter sp. JC586]